MIKIYDVFREDSKGRVVKGFSKEDLIVYLIVQIYYNPITKENRFTLGMLYKELGLNKRGTKIRENIKESIYRLDNMKIITLLDKQDDYKLNDLIRLKLLEYKDDVFTMADYEVIKLILDSEYRIDSKLIMIFIYVIIVSYKGNKPYSLQSIRTMENIIGISGSSIQRNINNLSQLDIIEYTNEGRYKTKDNEVRNSNNIYVIKINNENWIKDLRFGQRASKEYNKKVGNKLYNIDNNIKQKIDIEIPYDSERVF